MLRLANPAFVALLALAGPAVYAGTAAPARPLPSLDNIEWRYSAATGRSERAQLRFDRDRMNSSIGADKAPEIFGMLAGTTAGTVGDPVSFALARDAGALACNGTISEPGQAAGSCRFDPNEKFAEALAQRKLAPDDPDDYLALALVDAHVALVDGLARAGFQIDDSDKLIALAALRVTPEYADELKQAGLKIDDIDNLIAARGVGLDAAWLRGMADAGYPGLSFEQAIQMRATGVTPDYARRMARVLSATGAK